jgi:hypothetical protein
LAHFPPQRRREQEALNHYRRVRDEIKAFLESLPEAIMQDNVK